jgi:hypothetical protein
LHFFSCILFCIQDSFAVEILWELKLTTQDTASWGMVLWMWQKSFSIRRPDRATEHGLDETFVSARAASNSVRQYLPDVNTAGTEFVAAFQCTGPLNRLWMLFSECVVQFRTAKERLMLSLWDELTEPELRTGASWSSLPSVYLLPASSSASFDQTLLSPFSADTLQVALMRSQLFFVHQYVTHYTRTIEQCVSKIA